MLVRRPSNHCIHKHDRCVCVNEAKSPGAVESVTQWSQWMQLSTACHSWHLPNAAQQRRRSFSLVQQPTESNKSLPPINKAHPSKARSSVQIIVTTKYQDAACTAAHGGWTIT
jgi:hypothetical protein